jgi:methyl-accepting chemotaxis protein
MSRIADLSTGTKLAVSFGVMAVLIAVVGATGIYGMADLRHNNAVLYEKEALGVSHIKDANFAAIATQGAVRAALLDEKADRWMAEVKRRDTDFQREFAAYLATVSRQEDLAAAKEVETLFKELRETQDAVLGLVKKGAGTEARGMWGNLDPLLEALTTQLQALADHKSEAMEKTAARTFERFTVTRNVLLATMAAAIAAATLFGIVIMRMITRPLRRAARVLESVAAGDFTERLDIRSRDEVGRMALALNQALESVSRALTEVRTAADRTADASRQMSAAAEELAGGSHEQASSLEETAASLEEITGTLRQTAENAGKASEFAASSRKVAEKGGSAVASTVQAMREIETASRSIFDIVATIDGIAFQTNLLALNAAVEAARAGEHGRGFAVVAAEVRALAQRSAEAAREIKSLVQDSVAKVEAGSQLAARSGGTLDEIVGSAKKLTDLIAEIAGASREQSAGVDQVNRAIAQMEQVVQRNASQTEEINATSESLAAQAGQLQALVGQFKLDGGEVPAPQPQGETGSGTDARVEPILAPTQPTPRIASQPARTAVAYTTRETPALRAPVH